MIKRKIGLHKEISTIFDGVPIPKNNGTEQRPYVPELERSGYIPPKFQQPNQTPPKAAVPKQPKAKTTVKTTRQIQWQQTWEQIKNKLFAPKPSVSTTRQKTMVILVPVLFIILVFVLIRVFGIPSHKTSTPHGTEQVSVVASSNNKIDWQIPEPYPTTLRDPMQIGSAITTKPEIGELSVRGIVHSKDNPSAVIDKRIVREGEKVLGATVVKINKDSVEFEMNGKTWTQKVQ